MTCVTSNVFEARTVAIGDVNYIINENFNGIVLPNATFNKSGNTPVASSDVSRTSGQSLKSYLNFQTSSTKFRTEARLRGEQNIGGEYWIGMSIYFPSDFVFIPTWETIYQWHRTCNVWSDPSSPPCPANNPMFALELRNGKWLLFVRYCSTFNGGKNNGQQSPISGLVIDDVRLGEWNDIVHHTKWAHSAGQGGFTEFWINGSKVIDYDGPNCFNDNNGPYLKFGVYNGWVDGYSGSTYERTVYHDELKITDSTGSYAAVSP